MKQALTPDSSALVVMLDIAGVKDVEHDLDQARAPSRARSPASKY
jgi:hypothetical protein